MAGENESTLAVDGQGLYFYFDRKKKVPVLNDTNIAVTRGAIYSLLGPSGCGKTTLLKCIIGRHKIQEGSLRVYGRIPGSKGFPIPGRGVGYMPQELGLYFEMSIEEIIQYFASLYSMKRELISERLDFLVDLLALPGRKRTIQELSGGQQRRVSFAIALVHKPPLLILDEPTVGVDPLLRQTIWNHLVSLVKNENTTILITTHYTEEARQADTVGLMRNGNLIEEKNPQDLLKQHEVTTLEEVFLKLCVNASDEDKDHEKSHSLTNVESINPLNLVKNGGGLLKKETNGRNKMAMDVIYKSNGVFNEENGGHENTTALLLPSSLSKQLDHDTCTSEISASFHRYISLTRKDFLRVKRNIFMMSFSILIPTLQVVMFCLCMGSDPFDLPVAVVNLDEDINRYGEKYLLSISNVTIRQEKYDNFTTAYESVKNGETWAALYIGPEFSPCLVDRILEGVHASNDTLHCSLVKVYIDKSDEILANILFVALLEAYQVFASELLETFEKSTLVAEYPVRIEEYVYGSASTSFMEFVAPALFVCLAYVISIGLTAMALLEERRIGLYERSCVAGATAVEILMSFFFVMAVILVLQVIFMLTFGFFVFNIPCKGPLSWVMIGIILVGIGGMAYGLLIAVLTDDINTACIIICGSFFPIVILSGTIWPVEAMPHYLRYFSYCLPLTKMIRSLRSLTVRGWSVEEHSAWDGYVISNTWTVISIILAIIFLKLKK